MFGIVFGKLLRIQVHIVQIDIVCGKSLGHMGVSDAPVRIVRDAQNYTDAGADPGDRVRGNVPGDDRLVVQVDPADGSVVFVFIRVFKADLGTLFIAFQDLFRRNGPAVIEPLQLGTFQNGDKICRRTGSFPCSSKRSFAALASSKK